MEKINEEQELSILALVEYVSHEQSVAAALVLRLFEDHFQGGQNLASLPSSQYLAAIEFLVDLQVSLLLN